MEDQLSLAEMTEDIIQTWGTDAQIDMAIEEMSELIQALCHYRRNRTDAHKVSEEIADVLLMLDTISHLFGRENVAWWKHAKLARLKTRLDNAMKN